MAFLFGKAAKGTKVNDIIKAIKDALNMLERNTKGVEKASEDISKQLALIKSIFHGEGNTEPNPEQITQLSTEIYANDLLVLLCKHMNKLEFETKKDLATVFNFLLRRQVGSLYPTVTYLEQHAVILDRLAKGYESPDIALNCGAMLRECIRHESLAKFILLSDNFYKFFTFVDLTNFDLASDAFSTFKDLLTLHKNLVSEFLQTEYDKMFLAYTNLLYSQNYVTKRQSLKLLGELLLDRPNFNVMMKYISDPSNLKLMMMLLLDKSKSIQFEAFHVFKVFVANPNKPDCIVEIIQKNKEKLIKLLTKFHNHRQDEQFNEEKCYLLKQIEAL